MHAEVEEGDAIVDFPLDLLRISVGIEDPEDLCQDLDQALN